MCFHFSRAKSLAQDKSILCVFWSSKWAENFAGTYLRKLCGRLAHCDDGDNTLTSCIKQWNKSPSKNRSKWAVSLCARYLYAFEDQLHITALCFRVDLLQAKLLLINLKTETTERLVREWLFPHNRISLSCFIHYTTFPLLLRTRGFVPPITVYCNTPCTASNLFTLIFQAKASQIREASLRQLCPSVCLA